MKYLIKGKEIFTENKILDNSSILINDNIIEDIVTDDSYDYEVLDMSGYKIIPGLIDMHIHGANGFDTMDGNYNSLNEISKYLASYGVTSFLPTTVTSEWEKIVKAVKNIKESKNKGVDGAEIIGTYIEGPFITEKHKGAHPKDFIKDIDISFIKELLKISPSIIKIITVAPEKEKSIELIKYAKKNNIKVSLGHTNATYDETIKAINNGADIAVHTFNGMKGLHHREPGVVGAVLSSDIYGELIADNIHVHPAVMDIMIKAKGKDKICLITDSMRAGGLEDGEYQLGEQRVIVSNSIARIKSGSLAGSTLKLIKGVKNIIKDVNIKPIDAIHMASLVPAKILGIEDSVGSIRKNKRANLTIVDNDYNVVMTIVDGKITYKREGVNTLKGCNIE
ncbi:MAG: N-acetylglucosamine-6-phosphate deacetylase [Firmicutes bacterium]|nr:N-acetylglucosamine-6-phosphate deacetylase [Bacillota bacterium]